MKRGINNRAQITVFIIIALIIIGFVIIFFISLSKLKINEGDEINQDFQSLRLNEVNSFVEGCLRDVTNEGVIFIASRGGYYNLPDLFFDKTPPTAYYVYSSTDRSPGIRTVENELSNYIENQIPYCLEDNELREIKVKFSESDVRLTLENITYISLDMQTSISRGDNTATIEDYELEIENNLLYRGFMTSKLISDEVNKNPGTLRLIPIFKIADNDDFDIFINSYSEDTFIFSLVDKNNKEFIFNFAINWREENEI